LEIKLYCQEVQTEVELEVEFELEVKLIQNNTVHSSKTVF